MKSPEARSKVKATIFFSYTSNMISSGNREVIRFLVQHKMVDVIVTTAGGIEEDFLKCYAPHYMGDFRLKGEKLRRKGLNRIGNLIVPNKNYCLFEDWFAPLLNKMHDEQEADGTIWTPSSMIRRMGKEINNPDSVYYWAYKNDIPVYCPSLTDGSVGDMIFFHSYKREGFILDIAKGELRCVALRCVALRCVASGVWYVCCAHVRGAVAADVLAMCVFLFRHPWDERPRVAREEVWHDHSGRWSGEAPRVQRQPHAQRCGLGCVREHRPRVRRQRLRSSPRRGQVVGQNQADLRSGEGVCGRHAHPALAGCQHLCKVLPRRACRRRRRRH